MTPMLACAALPLPTCPPVFFAAIHFSLSLKSTSLQDFVHCSKRILLSLRHFSCQFRQPLFAARSAQRVLDEPRFQKLDKPLFPVFHMLPLSFTARLKMPLEFTHRQRQLFDSFV